MQSKEADDISEGDAVEGYVITNLFFQCVLTTFRVVKKAHQICDLFGQLSVLPLNTENFILCKNRLFISFMQLSFKMILLLENSVIVQVIDSFVKQLTSKRIELLNDLNFKIKNCTQCMAQFIKFCINVIILGLPVRNWLICLPSTSKVIYFFLF